MDKKVRTNYQIKAPEVRVIDEEGKNIGVLNTMEAVKMAETRGLDLIEISPNTLPPIAKIMDYGKFQYLENKKQKAAKAKTQISDIKSIQMSIGIGDRDLELKAKNASEFLKDGDKVKITLTLRGREKYLDKSFLRSRIDRLLKLITEEFKIIDELKPAQRGQAITIEKLKK